MIRVGLAVVLVVACGGNGKPTTAPDNAPGDNPMSPNPQSASKDDAVFEAVLLHEIAADKPMADEAICIALRGHTGDSRKLIAAIKARHPTVVPDSECQGGGPTGPVTVTATGGKAVRFDVGPVTWVTDTSAAIDGGQGHRGGHAHEMKYVVEKSGDAWKVTSSKPGLTM